MSEQKLLIFDLDGTINDSSPGIVYCFKKTADTLGKQGITDDMIAFQGLSGPFDKNIKSMFNLSEGEVLSAIKIYLEYYTSKGQNMSQLFPGIVDSLEELKEKGHVLSIATMMGEVFAKKTIEEYGISHLFKSIRGTDLATIKHKSELIDHCMYEANIGKEDTIMIGDGTNDWEAAQICGVGFVGITYGYDITAEFCNEKGIPYAEKPSDVARIVEEYIESK